MQQCSVVPGFRSHEQILHEGTLRFFFSKTSNEHALPGSWWPKYSSGACRKGFLASPVKLSGRIWNLVACRPFVQNALESESRSSQHFSLSCLVLDVPSVHFDNKKVHPQQKWQQHSFCIAGCFVPFWSLFKARGHNLLALSALSAITVGCVCINAIPLGGRVMQGNILAGFLCHFAPPSPDMLFHYSPKWNGISGETQEDLRTLAKCPIPLAPPGGMAYQQRFRSYMQWGIALLSTCTNLVVSVRAYRL